MAGTEGRAGWRIEEFADRVGLSVDTIRFYQKRRLLDPPERRGRLAFYTAAHEERLRRVRDLQAEGFTLAVIRRLLDGELAPVDVPLAAAVAVATADDAEEFLDLATLAARAGVPEPLVEAVVREGLLVPRSHDGEPRFTAGDVDVARAGLTMLEAGLPLPELLDLARRHHAATREIAETAVAMFDEHVRRPLLAGDRGDDERAARLVEAFRVLLPATSTLVEAHFRRVLLQVAQEHLESVGDPAELAAAQEASARRIEDGRPA